MTEETTEEMGDQLEMESGLLSLPLHVLHTILEACTVRELLALRGACRETRRRLPADDEAIWASGFRRSFGVRMVYQALQEQPRTSWHRRTLERLAAGRGWARGECVKHEGLHMRRVGGERAVSVVRVRGSYLLLGREEGWDGEGQVELWELGCGQCVCVLHGLHGAAACVDAVSDVVVAVTAANAATTWRIPPEALPEGVSSPLPDWELAAARVHSCYAAAAAPQDGWLPGDAPIAVSPHAQRTLPGDDGFFSLTLPHSVGFVEGGAKAEGRPALVVVSECTGQVHPEVYHVWSCPCLTPLRSVEVHSYPSRLDRELSLLAYSTGREWEGTTWGVVVLDLHTGRPVCAPVPQLAPDGKPAAQPDVEGAPAAADLAMAGRCAVTDLFFGGGQLLVELAAFNLTDEEALLWENASRVLMRWDLTPCLHTAAFPFAPKDGAMALAGEDEVTGEQGLPPVSVLALPPDHDTGTYGEFVQEVAFHAGPHGSVFVFTDKSEACSYRCNNDAYRGGVEVLRFEALQAGATTATALIAAAAASTGGGCTLAVWTATAEGGGQAVPSSSPSLLLDGEELLPATAMSSLLTGNQFVLSSGNWRWQVVAQENHVAILDFLETPEYVDYLDYLDSTMHS